MEEGLGGGGVLLLISYSFPLYEVDRGSLASFIYIPYSAITADIRISIA